MKSHVLVSIYDTKSGIFMQINQARSKADFIRSVQVEAKNPASMLHKFPSDYDLYIVGEWSETEGIMTWEKQRLGSVLDLCPLS